LIDKLMLGALAVVSLVIIALMIKIIIEKHRRTGRESKEASQPMEQEPEIAEDPSEDVEGDS